MVKLILATDMAKHKEIVDQLQSFVPVFDKYNREHLDSVRQKATILLIHHKEYFFNFNI